MTKLISILSLLCILSIKVPAIFAQDSNKYFTFRVIDQKTGRGVPLVELKTNNKISYYTDNNGIIAFYEPDLMNQEVYFHIKSHGYEYPADGFGYRGIALKVKPGDSALIKIRRINVAERLYRITGEGQYHHSLLVGYPVPVKQPLLKGKVMGQDTFVETLFKGKIYWLWGDTDSPFYPLGNFATSGATSLLPWKGGIDPEVGVELNYFVNDKGFSKKMCPLEGPGLVWMHWLTTLKDKSGNDRLIGSYTRVKNLEEAYEQGLVIFNETTELFEPFVRFKLNSPLFPDGHSFRAMVDGQEYLYFSFSTQYSLRVIADLEHVTDLSAYEGYTCLTAGSRYDTTHLKIDREPDGRLIYGWKTNTEPLNAKKEQFLQKKGELKAGETWFNLHDIQTGNPIISHSGSVFWNEFRKKWVMILQQVWGTSHLGEVWYVEGDTPTGPWIYARKIVTHDNYTFYNVGQHPLFDQQNGRLIYFEGTYTNSFSGNPKQTPRYDYNQIMYRLDLSNSLLYLPAPVYRIKNNKTNYLYLQREMLDSMNAWKLIEDIPFFAVPPDRKLKGMIPVFAEKKKGKIRLQVKTSGDQREVEDPLFYGLPELDENTLDGTWECLADDYPITLELETDGKLVKGKIINAHLKIEKGSLLNNQLELFIKDTTNQETFTIKALLKYENLSGEFHESRNGNTGVFTGKRSGELLKQYLSPMLVPLYEFQHKDGTYFYSVDSEKEGMKRSEKPVCRVWKNPSSVLTLDYKAKPVQLER